LFSFGLLRWVFAGSPMMTGMSHLSTELPSYNPLVHRRQED
jgi:hypothetical protein